MCGKKIRWRSGGSNLHTRNQSSPLHQCVTMSRQNELLKLIAKALNSAITGVATQLVAARSCKLCHISGTTSFYRKLHIYFKYRVLHASTPSLKTRAVVIEITMAKTYKQTTVTLCHVLRTCRGIMTSTMRYKYVH